MHIATCKILSYSGYYEHVGTDQNGWPAWKNVIPLPNLGYLEQENLMRQHIVEYFENEEIDVFVLKNQEDSLRLNETIKVFSQTNGLINFIFFTDPTIDTVKRVYDALEENYGISREWMARTSTR